jgi:hypothetical protein
MKRYNLGPEYSRQIGDYGSSFRLMRLHWSKVSEVRVDIAYLAPGEFIARHAAGLPQLFCVIAGNGWVSGEDEIEHPISASEAAFWVQGELHATRSDDGLTAVIIQSPELDPGALLISIPETE